jgi:hypothetical protein
MIARPLIPFTVTIRYKSHPGAAATWLESTQFYAANPLAAAFLAGQELHKIIADPLALTVTVQKEET